MAIQLTAEDARQSLNAHVAARGAELRAKYGPHIGWKELLRILADRACVRYPCEIVFDAGPLEPGEFAHPVAKGERPEDGFTMFVHPVFLTQLPQVPYLVLYQLVVVNYGEFASPDDAETFGASALGISRDEYYATICELASQIGGCGSGLTRELTAAERLFSAIAGSSTTMTRPASTIVAGCASSSAPSFVPIPIRKW